MAFEEEIAQIKLEHFEKLKSRRLIILVEADYGFDVEQWMPDGVAPTSSYDTAQEAAARVLQLLKLKDPVTPQNWPEVVGIGSTGGPPEPQPKIV
jgi:hypothetical protein